MQSLARVVGVYLSLCYVVLPVACVLLWRRGHALVAMIFLVVPIAAWGLWDLASVWLTPFARVHIGVGLLPMLAYFQLAPLAWLIALGTDRENRASPPDSSFVGVARTLLPTKAWAGIALVGVLGVLWFVYGLFALDQACAIGAAPWLRQLPRVMICASSAAGTWPLLWPLVVVGVVVFVGQQAAARSPAATLTGEGESR